MTVDETLRPSLLLSDRTSEYVNESNTNHVHIHRWQSWNKQ